MKRLVELRKSGNYDINIEGGKKQTRNPKREFESGKLTAKTAPFSDYSEEKQDQSEIAKSAHEIFELALNLQKIYSRILDEDAIKEKKVADDSETPLHTTKNDEEWVTPHLEKDHDGELFFAIGEIFYEKDGFLINDDAASYDSKGTLIDEEGKWLNQGLVDYGAAKLAKPLLRNIANKINIIYQSGEVADNCDDMGYEREIFDLLFRDNFSLATAKLHDECGIFVRYLIETNQKELFEEFYNFLIDTNQLEKFDSWRVLLDAVPENDAALSDLDAFLCSKGILEISDEEELEWDGDEVYNEEGEEAPEPESPSQNPSIEAARSGQPLAKQESFYPKNY